MSRSSVAQRLRSISFKFAFAVLVLVPLAPIAMATESTAPSASEAVGWPTPEGRAFEAARRGAGQMYADCLKAAMGDDDGLSTAAARSVCAQEGEQYAAYLPADKVETLLDGVAVGVRTPR